MPNGINVSLIWRKDAGAEKRCTAFRRRTLRRDALAFASRRFGALRANYLPGIVVPLCIAVPQAHPLGYPQSKCRFFEFDNGLRKIEDERKIRLAWFLKGAHKLFAGANKNNIIARDNETGIGKRVLQSRRFAKKMDDLDERFCRNAAAPEFDGHAQSDEITEAVNSLTAGTGGLGDARPYQISSGPKVQCLIRNAGNRCDLLCRVALNVPVAHEYNEVYYTLKGWRKVKN